MASQRCPLRGRSGGDRTDQVGVCHSFFASAGRCLNSQSIALAWVAIVGCFNASSDGYPTCLLLATQKGQALHNSIARPGCQPRLRSTVAEKLHWFLSRALGVRCAAVLCGLSRLAVGGGAVIHELLSPRLHDAWPRGDGRVEIHVLPHHYLRLAPAVATTCFRRSPIEGGQPGGQALKGHVAPFRSALRDRGIHRGLAAARRDALRHLVGAARLRARATSRGNGQGRRVVPPPTGGRRPESGQERPPRRSRFAAPALTRRGSLLPAQPDHRPPEETTQRTRFSMPFRCARRVGTARPSDTRRKPSQPSKPRTTQKHLVRHITRLYRENNERCSPTPRSSASRRSTG